MNKITEIHLNGKAFKLEEAGYQALQHYLQNAETKLKADPDAKEIVTDLEQAIADKCSALLKGDKDVVTTTEMTAILEEMGQVEADYSHQEPPKADAAGNAAGAGAANMQHKRLYTIPDGAMLAGVCKGLAAYFGVDVTVVRWIFVILTILGVGTAIVVYILLAIFLPRATTSAQIAEAYGRPVTAQEIVENGKERLAEVSERLRENDAKSLRLGASIFGAAIILIIIFATIHVIFGIGAWRWGW